MTRIARLDFVTMTRTTPMLPVAWVALLVVAAIVPGGIALAMAWAGWLYLMFCSSYDEYNGWEAFRMTFPFTRRQVIAGRFLGVAACIVATGVAGSACAAVFGFASQGMALPDSVALAAASARSFGSGIAVPFCVGLGSSLVLCGLYSDFSLKFGSKGAAVLYISIAVGLGIFGGGALVEWLTSDALVGLPAVSPALIAAGFVVGGVLIYLGCTWLGARIYEKKDF